MQTTEFHVPKHKRVSSCSRSRAGKFFGFRGSRATRAGTPGRHLHCSGGSFPHLSDPGASSGRTCPRSGPRGSHLARPVAANSTSGNGKGLVKSGIVRKEKSISQIFCFNLKDINTYLFCQSSQGGPRASLNVSLLSSLVEPCPCTWAGRRYVQLPVTQTDASDHELITFPNKSSTSSCWPQSC